MNGTLTVLCNKINKTSYYIHSALCTFMPCEEIVTRAFAIALDFIRHSCIIGVFVFGKPERFLGGTPV
jgi:hypothetical protein